MDFSLDFSLECIIKILCSIVIGFVLGLERKSRNQFIGSRTLILISVSSTLLSILSASVFNTEGGGDPTRISAGVVSGIGFLGGGVIMKLGINVRGLTSAAVIWTSAALGLAIGAGLFIPAFFVLFVILILLLTLERVEEKMFPAGRNKILHLCFEQENVDLKKLKSIIESHGFIICDLNISNVISTKQLILHYSVKAPKEENFSDLVLQLKEIGSLSEFSITD